RVVSERIAAAFPVPASAPIEILVQGASAGQLRALTARIRSVPGVAGTTVAASRGRSALMIADYAGPSNGTVAHTVVQDIRALPRPAGSTVLVGGAPSDDVDLLASLVHRLPTMATPPAVAT